MLDKKNRTLHAHPSLLLLRMALTAAERESPAHPHRVDSNERLAMQLIARMQAHYKRADPFLMQGKRYHEMAGRHA